MVVNIRRGRRLCACWAYKRGNRLIYSGVYTYSNLVNVFQGVRGDESSCSTFGTEVLTFVIHCHYCTIVLSGICQHRLPARSETLAPLAPSRALKKSQRSLNTRVCKCLRSKLRVRYRTHRISAKQLSISHTRALYAAAPALRSACRTTSSMGTR